MPKTPAPERRAAEPAVTPGVVESAGGKPAAVKRAVAQPAVVKSAVKPSGVNKALVNPQPRPQPVRRGSLDARPSIAKIAVSGPFPRSQVQSAVARVLPQLRSCYRAAARRAGRTPKTSVKLSFVVDEGRRAKSVKVGKDTLGLAPCVRKSISRIRTRVAPDLGTATAYAIVRFTPVK